MGEEGERPNIRSRVTRLEETCFARGTPATFSRLFTSEDLYVPKSWLLENAQAQPEDQMLMS